MSARGRHHRLVAKLPQLGPLIGWVQREQNGARARLWAKADDSYGGRAVLALTVPMKQGTPAGDQAKFWKVLPTKLEETDPPVVQRFALADVELPVAGVETVRMLMLHVEDKDAGHGLPAIYGKATGFKTIELQANTSGSYPGPEAVDYREFAGDPPAQPQAEFVAELFRQLGEELAESTRLGNAPIPETYSRLRRREASLARCEVSLRAAADRLPLCFAAGCCRHPGVEFDRELADRALAGLAAHAGQNRDLAFVCMLGDQIYADATAGVLDVDGALEKYTARYDAAFDSSGFRDLTSRVPVYMTADDHEIRDGWPNDDLPQPAGEDYWSPSVEWAWQLYFAHQRSHGPRRTQPSLLSKPDPTSLWYRFEDRGVPFFFFDTRFERQPAGTEIVGAGQIEVFADWLADVAAAEAQNRELRYVPKFVVCGTVLSPGLEEFESGPERVRRADTWQAYVASRAEVVRRIVARGLQNVVFLSGDYHCAAIGSLRFQDGIQGYAIVAPPFYAPFPFANVRERDVSATECIRDRGRSAPLLAVCEAKALEVQGFALICVRRLADPPQTPRDWNIEVGIYRHCWNENGQPHAQLVKTGLLANGTASWVT